MAAMFMGSNRSKKSVVLNLKQEQAQAALDVWTYRIQKYIGAYNVAVGGADAIVFTAGIGENDCEACEHVINGLSFMGVKIDPCAWFLNDANDVRSSYYLEDAGSEFDVQGLELDWTMVVWDGDLMYQPQNPSAPWRFRSFSGTRWQEIRQEVDQRYRLNAYRVLLTRARQGMVIVVPEGDEQDSTRDSQFYDPSWEYLALLGIPEVLIRTPA